MSDEPKDLPKAALSEKEAVGSPGYKFGFVNHREFDQYIAWRLNRFWQWHSIESAK